MRCSVADCERGGKITLGRCRMHYQRHRSTGTDQPAVRVRARRNAVIGDTRRHTRGYVLEFTEEGWRLQHRVVMERRLGRALLPDEQVHHRDGNKTNNADSNLELWVAGQPNGVRVEDALAWAHTIIERYENARVL